MQHQGFLLNSFWPLQRVGWVWARIWEETQLLTLAGQSAMLINKTVLADLSEHWFAYGGAELLLLHLLHGYFPPSFLNLLKFSTTPQVFSLLILFYPIFLRTGR